MQQFRPPFFVTTDAPPDLDSVIRLYGYDLELKDYPIWDESKREWLNERIIDHFRYRQIGTETPTKFIFFLNRKMYEIMPTINPIFVELSGVDSAGGLYSFTTETESNATSNKTSETSGTGENLISDTPQTQLSGYENYATSLTETKQAATAQEGGTDQASQTTRGKQGNSATIAAEWLTGANNALNILFAMLEPCFLQRWD